MTKEDLYWYWINNIKGIGRRTISLLLEEFETPWNLYETAENRVLERLNKESVRRNFLQSKNMENVREEYARLQEKNIIFLHPQSRDYPDKLRRIPDAPMGLYYKGKLPERKQKAVAIIGARNCSRYGVEMARFFGRELAKCNIAVISGLARGIDGMAHRGALEGNGYTLGILGGGIDVVYPVENYQLFAEMERRGGIMSESNTGVEPVAGLFPQRNRLISGMADGILVVEAKEKSGTFITVDQGLEQGKEIFALPGKLTDSQSAGCNNLIKMGAYIVTEISDILEILNCTEKQGMCTNSVEEIIGKTQKNTLAPNEKMVYSCLRVEPKYLDDIIKEVKIAPQEVCRVLNAFVVKGMIVEPVRNYYAIKL